MCLRNKVSLSCSLLRPIVDVKTAGDLPDVFVELNHTNFNDLLRRTPATFDSSPHWCPACRNYKPHYEKVARIFNGPNASHPGIILMCWVDCVLKWLGWE